MNTDTGRIFTERMQKNFSELLRQHNVEEIDRNAHDVMQPMPPSERVPFWKNVKGNALRKGTRRI